MENNTGKVGDFCQSGKVGILFKIISVSNFRVPARHANP